MKTQVFKNIAFVGMLFLLFSCGNDNNPPQVAENLKGASQQELMTEKLLNANAQILNAQNTQIDNYIERRKWNMQTMPDGARMEQYQKGTGKHLSIGDTVSLKYTLELINGVQVYNSNKDGVLTFEIGKSEVPTGLQNAVLLLSPKSKAKIILPSILGYGLSGDGNLIPKHAILIYDIEIL